MRNTYVILKMYKVRDIIEKLKKLKLKEEFELVEQEGHYPREWRRRGIVEMILPKNLDAVLINVYGRNGALSILRYKERIVAKIYGDDDIFYAITYLAGKDWK